MKTITKIGFGIATAVLLFTGCTDSAMVSNTEAKKQQVSEESLGLRKVDLYSETLVTPDKTQYSKAAPMSGKYYDRAFQDAPPMIPHDVEGMLPVTISMNQCVDCHMPEMAAAMNATPIPVSHLTDFRPMTTMQGDDLAKNGKVIENTSTPTREDISIKEGTKLVGARFNCTLCHAPQSEGGLVVESTFKPEFTTSDGARKSNWVGTKLTEGLDTLKD